MTSELNNLENIIVIVESFRGIQESIMKFRLSHLHLKSYLPDSYLQKKDYFTVNSFIFQVLIKIRGV